MKFIIFLLFPVLGFAQKKFEKKVFFDKIEVLIPKELKDMPDEDWVLKYHNTSKPEVALSDENGEINFLIDLTEIPSTDAQLIEFEKSKLNNMQKRHPDYTFLEEGAQLINGKNFTFIKFSFDAVDQKVFNYYLYSIFEGKIIYFTFNCMEKLKKDWGPAADKIISSIQFR